MKITCTKDLTHDRFHVKARVMETQEVDGEGNHLETVEQYDFKIVTEDGDPELVCALCGSQARMGVTFPTQRVEG